MLQHRPGDARGHVEHGWLDAWHSFSFSSYHDPRWMGFGSLRVINEDRVVPTAGFPPHGHRDMEIITYVLGGELKHRDSTGTSGVLRHGDLQVMSAGRGISHSEVNPSTRETLHLLQIWIEPAVRGTPPAYAQQALDQDALRRGFSTVVGPEHSGAAFTILQDARLLIAWPTAGTTLNHVLDPQRRYYLHLARGRVTLGADTLVAGDALLFEHETALALTAAEDSELLLFDLA